MKSTWEKSLYLIVCLLSSCQLWRRTIFVSFIQKLHFGHKRCTYWTIKHSTQQWKTGWLYNQRMLPQKEKKLIHCKGVVSIYIFCKTEWHLTLIIQSYCWERMTKLKCWCKCLIFIIYFQSKYFLWKQYFYFSVFKSLVLVDIKSFIVSTIFSPPVSLYISVHSFCLHL